VEKLEVVVREGRGLGECEYGYVTNTRSVPHIYRYVTWLCRIYGYVTYIDMSHGCVTHIDMSHGCEYG